MIAAPLWGQSSICTTEHAIYNSVMDDSATKEVSPEQHFCDICNLEYLTKNDLEEHTWSLLHHKRLDKEKGRGYAHKCTLCNVDISGFLLFTKHIHGDEHQKKLQEWKTEHAQKTPVEAITEDNEPLLLWGADDRDLQNWRMPNYERPWDQPFYRAKHFGPRNFFPPQFVPKYQAAHRYTWQPPGSIRHRNNSLKYRPYDAGPQRRFFHNQKRHDNATNHHGHPAAQYETPFRSHQMRQRSKKNAPPNYRSQPTDRPNKVNTGSFGSAENAVLPTDFKGFEATRKMREKFKEMNKSIRKPDQYYKQSVLSENGSSPIGVSWSDLDRSNHRYSRDMVVECRDSFKVLSRDSKSVDSTPAKIGSNDGCEARCEKQAELEEVDSVEAKNDTKEKDDIRGEKNEQIKETDTKEANRNSMEKGGIRGERSEQIKELDERNKNNECPFVGSKEEEVLASFVAENLWKGTEGDISYIENNGSVGDHECSTANVDHAAEKRSIVGELDHSKQNAVTLPSASSLNNPLKDLQVFSTALHSDDITAVNTLAKVACRHTATTSASTPPPSSNASQPSKDVGRRTFENRSVRNRSENGGLLLPGDNPAIGNQRKDVVCTVTNSLVSRVMSVSGDNLIRPTGSRSLSDERNRYTGSRVSGSIHNQVDGQKTRASNETKNYVSASSMVDNRNVAQVYSTQGVETSQTKLIGSTTTVKQIDYPATRIDLSKPNFSTPKNVNADKVKVASSQKAVDHSLSGTQNAGNVVGEATLQTEEHQAKSCESGPTKSTPLTVPRVPAVSRDYEVQKDPAKDKGSVNMHRNTSAHSDDYASTGNVNASLETSILSLDESLKSSNLSNQCEFRYKDGRRCPTSAEQKFCNYHEKVVRDVYNYYARTKSQQLPQQSGSDQQQPRSEESTPSSTHTPPVSSATSDPTPASEPSSDILQASRGNQPIVSSADYVMVAVSDSEDENDHMSLQSRFRYLHKTGKNPLIGLGLSRTNFPPNIRKLLHKHYGSDKKTTSDSEAIASSSQCSQISGHTNTNSSVSKAAAQEQSSFSVPSVLAGLTTTQSMPSKITISTSSHSVSRLAFIFSLGGATLQCSTNPVRHDENIETSNMGRASIVRDQVLSNANSSMSVTTPPDSRERISSSGSHVRSCAILTSYQSSLKTTPASFSCSSVSSKIAPSCSATEVTLEPSLHIIQTSSYDRPQSMSHRSSTYTVNASVSGLRDEEPRARMQHFSANGGIGSDSYRLSTSIADIPSQSSILLKKQVEHRSAPVEITRPECNTATSTCTVPSSTNHSPQLKVHNRIVSSGSTYQSSTTDGMSQLLIPNVSTVGTEISKNGDSCKLANCEQSTTVQSKEHIAGEGEEAIGGAQQTKSQSIDTQLKATNAEQISIAESLQCVNGTEQVKSAKEPFQPIANRGHSRSTLEINPNKRTLLQTFFENFRKSHKNGNEKQYSYSWKKKDAQSASIASKATSEGITGTMSECRNIAESVAITQSSSKNVAEGNAIVLSECGDIAEGNAIPRIESGDEGNAIARTESGDVPEGNAITRTESGDVAEGSAITRTESGYIGNAITQTKSGDVAEGSAITRTESGDEGNAIAQTENGDVPEGSAITQTESGDVAEGNAMTISDSRDVAESSGSAVSESRDIAENQITGSSSTLEKNQFTSVDKTLEKQTLSVKRKIEGNRSTKVKKSRIEKDHNEDVKRYKDLQTKEDGINNTLKSMKDKINDAEKQLILLQKNLPNWYEQIRTLEHSLRQIWKEKACILSHLESGNKTGSRIGDIERGEYINKKESLKEKGANEGVGSGKRFSLNTEKERSLLRNGIHDNTQKKRWKKACRKTRTVAENKIENFKDDNMNFVNKCPSTVADIDKGVFNPMQSNSNVLANKTWSEPSALSDLSRGNHPDGNADSRLSAVDTRSSENLLSVSNASGITSDSMTASSDLFEFQSDDDKCTSSKIAKHRRRHREQKFPSPQVRDACSPQGNIASASDCRRSPRVQLTDIASLVLCKGIDMYTPYESPIISLKSKLSGIEAEAGGKNCRVSTTMSQGKVIAGEHVSLNMGASRTIGKEKVITSGGVSSNMGASRTIGKEKVITSGDVSSNMGASRTIGKEKVITSGGVSSNMGASRTIGKEKVITSGGVSSNMGASRTIGKEKVITSGGVSSNMGASRTIGKEKVITSGDVSSNMGASRTIGKEKVITSGDVSSNMGASRTIGKEKVITSGDVSSNMGASRTIGREKVITSGGVSSNMGASRTIGKEKVITSGDVSSNMGASRTIGKEKVITSGDVSSNMGASRTIGKEKVITSGDVSSNMGASRTIGREKVITSGDVSSNMGASRTIGKEKVITSGGVSSNMGASWTIGKEKVITSGDVSSNMGASACNGIDVSKSIPLNSSIMAGKGVVRKDIIEGKGQRKCLEKAETSNKLPSDPTKAKGVDKVGMLKSRGCQKHLEGQETVDKLASGPLKARDVNERTQLERWKDSHCSVEEPSCNETEFEAQRVCSMKELVNAKEMPFVKETSTGNEAKSNKEMLSRKKTPPSIESTASSTGVLGFPDITRKDFTAHNKRKYSESISDLTSNILTPNNEKRSHVASNFVDNQDDVVTHAGLSSGMENPYWKEASARLKTSSNESIKKNAIKSEVNRNFRNNAHPTQALSEQQAPPILGLPESLQLFSNATDKTDTEMKPVLPLPHHQPVQVGSMYKPHIAAITGLQHYQGLLYSSSDDSTIKVHNITNRKLSLKASVTCESPVKCIEIHSRDTKPMLIAGFGSQVLFYDLCTLENRRKQSFPAEIEALHVRFRNLYVGLRDGSIYITSLKNMCLNGHVNYAELIKSCSSKTQGARPVKCIKSTVICDKNGILKRLLVVLFEDALCFLDAMVLSCIRTFVMQCSCLTVHKKKFYLGFKGDLYCGDLEELHTPEVFCKQRGEVVSLIVFGDFLISSSSDRLITCFSIYTGEILQVYGDPCGIISVMRSIPGDQKAVYGGNEIGGLKAFVIDSDVSVVCEWQYCGLPFGITIDLKMHLLDHHVKSLTSDRRCNWKSCSHFYSDSLSQKGLEDDVRHINNHLGIIES